MGELVDFPAPSAQRPEPPTAAYGMSVVVDSAGFVLVRLHDETGKVYAQASIPPASAPTLVDQVRICANASAALHATTCPMVH